MIFLRVGVFQFQSNPVPATESFRGGFYSTLAITVLFLSLVTFGICVFGCAFKFIAWFYSLR